MGMYDKAINALNNWKLSSPAPAIDVETRKQINDMMHEQQVWVRGLAHL